MGHLENWVVFSTFAWNTFRPLCLNVAGYIDPGTGSFIIQILIAGLCGGLLAIKLFWNNIKSVFSKLFHKDAENKKNAD